MGRRAGLLERFTAAETEAADLTEAQRKAEADLEPVRARLRRDQQRLDDGSVQDAKALKGLQDEVASLTRRISDLEDAELEVMESLEAARDRFAGVKTERVEIETEIRALMGRRDAEFAAIDAELAERESERETLTRQVPGELMTLYDKIAVRNVTGAAQIDGGRCTGCRIDLDPAELTAIEKAMSDDVVRCDECGRILVR